MKNKQIFPQIKKQISWKHENHLIVHSNENKFFYKEFR